MTSPDTPSSEPQPRTISLLTLPDDIYVNIISFLPELPETASSIHLKRAYENLSLARLQARYAYFSNSQVQNVTEIDPFPEISHLSPPAHLPRYAKPKFLAFLVGLCRNLHTLRAPCLTGVLQYASHNLRSVRFIDTGLSDADLLFISHSHLRSASIKNPSPAVLSALAQVRTLEAVSLRQISEESLPQVLNFLDCTTADTFYAGVNTAAEEALVALLRGLPSLKAFTVYCDVDQLWVIRYLRRLAKQIELVELTVGGVSIEIQNICDHDTESYEYDREVTRVLVCRKDLRTREITTTWSRHNRLREIDIEVLEQAMKQGADRTDIEFLISNYFDSEEGPYQEADALLVCFGRSIPSVQCGEDRISLIRNAIASDYATHLEISQDIAFYAWNPSKETSSFFERLLGIFSTIRSLHLCAPRDGRVVSTRFVMGLAYFLSRAVSLCDGLGCVYLEDAGELVLQNGGMLTLSNGKRVKEMIRAVMTAIEALETSHSVEMGTVIAQLELWERHELRVVERKDLDDVVILPRGGASDANRENSACESDSGGHCYSCGQWICCCPVTDRDSDDDGDDSADESSAHGSDVDSGVYGDSEDADDYTDSDADDYGGSADEPDGSDGV